MSKISAIIVAAGEGKRFGDFKQHALLKGKPVLDWCLETFETHSKISEIVLVLRKGELEGKLFRHYKKISAIAQGGKKRQDSVVAGFMHIDPKGTEIVLVHDGARPLVGKRLIDSVIEVAKVHGAAIPVIPIEDTVKRIEGQKVKGTEERSVLFRAQTPQGFAYHVLKEALEKARMEGRLGTDEASLVEQTGRDVFIVPGERRNIKITSPEDLKIAEALLED